MPISKTNSLLSDLDLSLLRHFFAVASFGGFSRAARAVGVSQPALSQGLQKLERTLGVALIDRKAKEFSLTPEGHKFFAFCRRLEGSLEGILDDLAVEGMRSKRRLRVGTAYSIGFQPLVNVCGNLARTKEPIELDLVAQGSYQIVSDLVSGALDAAIVPDEVHDTRLKLRSLTEDRVTVIAGEKLAAGFGRPSNWKEAMTSVPLVTYPRETPMRYLVDRICTREGLDYKTVISVNGIEALKSMVYRNVGVGFILRSLVEDEIRSKRLTEIRLPIAMPRRGAMLATRRGETGEEIADLMLKLMGSARGAGQQILAKEARF